MSLGDGSSPGLKILCPYEPAIHPLCEAKLPEGAERVRMGTNESAYWSLLSQTWREGQGFVVIEHDIEIHEKVIPEFTACSELWCTFPYYGPGFGSTPNHDDSLLYTSLGCAKFSTELLQRHPDVLDVAANDPAFPSFTNWRSLDVRIASVLRNKKHIEVHEHEPRVYHHHKYRGKCACAYEHPEYVTAEDGRYPGE